MEVLLCLTGKRVGDANRGAPLLSRQKLGVINSSGVPTFLMQKIKHVSIANAKIKKTALPMQKLRKICIANAKSKKKLAFPMQKVKKELHCGCKK